MKKEENVTDEEKKNLGELLLLVANDKGEIKRILLKMQTVRYIQKHIIEIGQNSDKYGISDIVDLLENISSAKIILDKIYPGDDDIPGFYDIEIQDVLYVYPEFDGIERYSVREFCRQSTKDELEFSECIDSLKHVKVVLRMLLRFHFLSGTFAIASVLLELY